MIKAWFALSMACALAVAAGCEGPSPTAQSHTPLRQRSVSPAAAFAAAEQVLGERFPIQVREPRNGLLRTAHIDTVSSGPSGRLTDGLSTPRRVRKSAEVRVEPADDGVKIWCQVVVEQNETSAHRMFAQEHSLSDLPSDTPADAEGATTAEQNTVWRYKGRDRQLEREIRRAIQELLAAP